MTQTERSYEPVLRSTVYAIRHNKTGRIYVGATNRLGNRIKQHIDALREGRHPNELMQSDFYKYGDDFSFCILHDFYRRDEGALYLVERMFMTILKTRNPEYGYNYKDNSTDFKLDSVTFHKIDTNRFLREGDLEPRSSGYLRSSKKNSSHFYALRVNARVKGSDLAKAVGVTRQAVDHWDRGESKPKREIIHLVAAALGVTVDELLREEAGE